MDNILSKLNITRSQNMHFLFHFFSDYEKKKISFHCTTYAWAEALMNLSCQLIIWL